MDPPLILIVEDESIIAALITNILALEGYQTQRATTVADAIERAHEAPPDLVILDIWLETPDAGWHFLQALRRDTDLATTPVLVCSADVFFIDDHLVALQTPRTDVLCKPFPIEALIEKVHVALEVAS